MAVQHIEFEDARANLEELLERAARGEEIVITRGKQPLVRLVPPKRARRQFGSARGLVTAPHDFDEPLDDFGEYR